MGVAGCRGRRSVGGGEPVRVEEEEKEEEEEVIYCFRITNVAICCFCSSILFDFILPLKGILLRMCLI